MTATRVRRPSLAVEALEDRAVPTTATLLSSGVLYVSGSGAADRIAVTQDVFNQVRVYESGYLVAINGGYSSVAASAVSKVVVDALSGNDTVQLGGSLPLRRPAEIYGGAGNDTLTGGASNDYLDGGSGSDVKDGGQGINTYYEPYSPYLPAVGGATRDDIQQAYSGTCAVLASLSAAASTGVDFASRIRYLGNNTYAVGMYHPYTGAPLTVNVVFNGTWSDNTILATKANPTAADQFANDPKPTADGEFWVILYQRAFLQVMNGLDPYGQGYALSSNTLTALTGRATLTVASPGTFGSGDLGRIQQALAQGRALVAVTYPAGAKPLSTSALVNSHVYSVLGVYSSGGTWFVRVRNPWAKDGPNGALQGANDGHFDLAWSHFSQSMSAYFIN